MVVQIGHRLGDVRKQARRFLDVDQARGISVASPRHTAAEQRKRVLRAMADGRVQSECFVEILNRKIEALQLRPRQSPVAKCVGVRHVLSDGAVEVCESSPGIAQTRGR